MPCRGGMPALTESERNELLRDIPGWEIALDEPGADDPIPVLRKSFRCRKFAGALEFANAVGDAAEAAGHHPAILIEWGRVTVTWWTHAIHGLHRNDFIMAARTDESYDQRKEV